MMRIMALPDVVERLAKIEIRAVGGSSAEFACTVKPGQASKLS